MKTIFKEYWHVILQKRWAFVLVLAAIVCATFCDIYLSVFYKNIANGFAQGYSADNLALIMHNFMLVALFYLIMWLSWRVVEIGIIPLEAGGINLLEKRCFDVLKRQKLAFFENSFSGGLIKKSNRFARAYEHIMDWFLFVFMQSTLSIVVSFIIFYQHYPELALYFLIWVVLFISWAIGFSLWQLKFEKCVAESDSTLGGAYSDAISNIFIVKSFALEKREQDHIDNTSDAILKARKTAWILMFISFAVQGVLAIGIELLLVYLMIGKWQQGLFNVGEFVLFQSILIILVQRLWEFGRHFRDFFTAIADAAEMADIFANNELEQDAPTAKALTIAYGGVEFKQINFNYAGNYKKPNKPVCLFDDFSLHIKPGEKVALVGPSGSGKTSLTKLLFRFYQPQQGEILFDGQNAEDFTLESLRQQISLVPQQPELFHRTIRENICLNGAVSEAELHQAAANSGSLTFIQNLPEQFDTLVGERGVKLSGGEKQRIALARAFLENAPIVVLDEATSALDSITEKQIQNAIFELISDKTAIVIAHRLSTILRMDRILVLDKGTIIESGTHQQLLDKKGKYADMWQHQSGEFLDIS